MEYHSVPVEERARCAKGDLLPYGYVYTDESRNPRRPPEESGSFGKRRNGRYSSTRSGTRTGTPAKRENQNVAEFGRLFALQQEEEQANRKLLTDGASSTTVDTARKPADSVATQCILYGYKDRSSEWKAIDQFERISKGYICEDYSRTDPDITPKYPQLLSSGDVVIHRNLSADANRKAKRYDGGEHWIKVTFDSFASADRACSYSPQEIDGFSVHCEMYHGHGPGEDAAIMSGSSKTGLLKPSKPYPFGSMAMDKPSQIAEYALNPPLRPLAPTPLDPNIQPFDTISQQSTTTASSITVTAPKLEMDTLRHRTHQTPQSEYMTHIPNVRKAILRPTSEALPPQPSMGERIIRSIPILRWFSGDIVGDGPILTEDGSFDHEKSNIYWQFWYMVDRLLGTDLCGLREDS